MDSSSPSGMRRLLVVVLAAAIASALALTLVAVREPNAGQAVTDHHEAAASHGGSKISRAELRLHDRMRKLWEDHIVWTRLAIISFAEGVPDLEPTLARLLRNQEDIGDAVKPYYGRKAANALTELLKEHINGAVDVLVAADSGDQQAFEEAKAAWYANGNEVADFLNQANPRNWRRGEMREMMRAHLDQTLDEAAHRLAGDYAADIRDYERIHRHILMMADELTDGIVAQFPRRF
jgi:hypothetical protein